MVQRLIHHSNNKETRWDVCHFVHTSLTEHIMGENDVAQSYIEPILLLERSSRLSIIYYCGSYVWVWWLCDVRRCGQCVQVRVTHVHDGCHNACHLICLLNNERKWCIWIWRKIFFLCVTCWDWVVSMSLYFSIRYREKCSIYRPLSITQYCIHALQKRKEKSWASARQMVSLKFISNSNCAAPVPHTFYILYLI